MQADHTDNDPIIPRPKFHNAIDELLEGGAVAGPTAQTLTSKLQPAATKSKNGTGSSLFKAGNGILSPKSQLTKIGARSANLTVTTTQPKPVSATQDATRTDTLRARPVRAAKNSAMAALRAKRDSMYSTQPEQQDKVNSDEMVASQRTKKTVTATKTTSGERQQLPTPLTHGSDYRPKIQRSTVGKLPTHLPKVAVAAISELKATGDGMGRKRKATPDHDDVQQDHTAGRSGALKRPNKSAMIAKAKVPRKDTYEVSDDEMAHQDTSRAAALPPVTSTRPLKDSEAPRRGGRPVTASSTPQPKKRQRSVSRVSKASTLKSNAGGKARKRMQEASVSARATPTPGYSVIPSSNRALQESTSHNLNPNQPVAKGESSQGKENAQHNNTGGHSAKPGVPFPANGSDGVAHGRLANRATPVRAVHDEPYEICEAGIELQSQARQIPNSSNQVLGNGQEDAIIVPDDSNTTSPVSSIVSPPLQPLLSGAPLRPSVQRPETPANDFRSSPPASQRVPASALESTRPHIISFGANGPLNQGALSTRTSLPTSGKSTQVLPDRSGLKRKETSSQAKLRARKMDTHGPSIKKSNVATDGEDIFAAFPTGGKIRRPIHVVRQPGSQNSSQPPNQDQDQDQDDGFVHIDEYDGTTLVDEPSPVIQHNSQPTASQIAMPPPERQGKAAKKASRLSEFSTRVLPAQIANSASENVGLGQPIVQKRKHADLMVSKPEFMSKRAKIDSQKLDLVSQAEGSHSIFANDKAAQAELKNGAQKPASPKRMSRRQSKVTRRASQGTRQVDITGSPFPPGMAVGDRDTAREVYSQQANLSSDRVAGAVEASAKAVKQSAGILPAVHLPPRYTQPEIMSSNIKPLPAAPHEESRAIHRKVSGAVANQLKTKESTTDPFTTSSNDSRSPQRAKQLTAFQRRLQQDFGVTAGATEAHSQYPQQADNDPDRTLVDDDDHSHNRVLRRSTSVSTDSASESSAASDKIDQDDDIAAWRRALQPHQSNLFDSLVVVSHKLVRCLVDQETAVQDIKNDLQREGLQIIQTMEQTHAQAHANYVSSLAQNKKTASKELKKQESKLGKLVQKTASQKKEKSQVARSWVEAERSLDQLLEMCT